MMSTLTFIRKNKIAIILSLSVSLAANLAQPMRLDDATFLETFTSHGNDLWAWAQDYWITWSGRIVPHAVFMILLSISPELVNILNAIMTTLSIVLSCMWASAGRKENTFTESLTILLMTAALYILTPTEILDVTVFWKTASVLYIWGFAAMLYVLLPFMPAPQVHTNADKKKSASRDLRTRRSDIGKSLLLLLPALYCAGFEPSGSFYFAFGGIMILLSAACGLPAMRSAGLWNSFFEGQISSGRIPEHVSRHVVLCWLITSAMFFRFLTAPGNMVRFEEEALFWFPNYGLLGFVDKLFLGTCYTLGACLGELYLPMLMLSLAILLLMIVKKRGVVLTLTALLPALYYSLHPVAGESFVYAFVRSDVYGLYPPANWFATFLGMLVLLIIAFLIFMGISDTLEFVNTLFFCGAVAEQIVMGFTPTVGVSISRSTFFSRELLMIPIFSLLITLLAAVCRGIRTSQTVKKWTHRE